MARQITACDPFRRGIEQMFRNADFSGLKLQISGGNIGNLPPYCRLMVSWKLQ